MENLTTDTLPKRRFGPPSYGAFSTPLRCQCSVFPVQKSTTEQTRSSFGVVQKFSGGRVLGYVFHPPYVLHPPHITAQSRVHRKKGAGKRSEPLAYERSPGDGGRDSNLTLSGHKKSLLRSLSWLPADPQERVQMSLWSTKTGA